MAQIHELIPKVMAEVGAIGKGRRNQQQGYSFRGIDDLYNAIQPALINAGIFVVPKVEKREVHERATKNGGLMQHVVLDVHFDFFAPDGSKVEAVTVGEAMDSGDKSCNKAMSAAQKYAFLQVFCIPTEEPKDSENDSPEPVATKKQPSVKAPASNDPLADDKQFNEMVAAQFKQSGFNKEQALAAVADMKAKRKIQSIVELSLKNREGFITAIADGKFDEFKKTEGK